MPAIHRAVDAAARRSESQRRGVGRQVRDARVSRGLSQRVVAAAIGVSQSQVSRIELGRYPPVTIGTLARLAAVVGLEISMKLYPGGEPLRDQAHVALLARFRRAVGDAWRWQAEVPLPIQGDRRSWDRVLQGDRGRIAVEAETRPTDAQDLQRRLALKKRDGGIERLILVLANTDWNRRLIRINDFTETFPVPGKVGLRALHEGRDPGGDAVILI